MSAYAEPNRVGIRIAEARRRLGLTQRRFADHLGIPLWTLNRLEAGASDATPYIPSIARLSGLSAQWFVGGAEAATLPTTVRAPRMTALRWHPTAGRDLVLCSFALLVLIRFFTEVVHVVPRALNFVDIPIFLVLSLAALTRPRRTGGATSFAVPVVLFVGLCAISVVLNPTRVEAGPVLVFVYGFLAPIGVYAATYRLWPAGNALSLSRLLVALTIGELLVVAFVDLPRFIQTSNPDVVSGTFGTNGYQLVFFLLVVTALLAGIFTFERQRLAARIAPALFAAILAAIFLAQYRALLVTTALTVLFIGALLGARGRGIVAGTIIAVSFGFTLSYVAQHFPSLRLSSTLATLRQDPTFYASKRLKTVDAVGSLYSDHPSFMLTGSGPGTFSSRAWQTFAHSNSQSGSNVQGRYARALTGGRVYQTDVSDKYVVPLRPVIGGSRAVTSPFSSYTSLLAEVGVGGFLLIVGVYLVATARAIRMTFRAVGSAVPGDPLPALLLACSVAFLVLLQMGFLENWLEVTRVTFPAWILLGVTSKELAEREKPT